MISKIKVKCLNDDKEFSCPTEAAEFYHLKVIEVTNSAKSNIPTEKGLQFQFGENSMRTKIAERIEKRWKITLIEKFDKLNEVLPNGKKHLKEYLFKCNRCGYKWKQRIRWNRNLSCPMCHPANHGSSRGELELYNYFLTTGYKILHNDRQLLEGKELDIYLPELNIAVEYDGAHWHNEKEIEEKNKLCEQKGVKIFHVDDNIFCKEPKKVLSDIKKFFNIDFQFKEISELYTDTNKCRKIICTDTMEVFDSYVEVSQKFEISLRAPISACNGHIKSCKGFHFQWYDENKKYKQTKKRLGYNSKAIECVETGKIYSGIAEAKRETGITTIGDNLAGRQKSAGGLHWKYLSNVSEISSS